MTKKQFIDSLTWIDGPPVIPEDEYCSSATFGERPIAVKLNNCWDSDEKEEVLVMGDTNLQSGRCSCCGEITRDDISANAYLYQES
jgi:hypothetical protein